MLESIKTDGNNQLKEKSKKIKTGKYVIDEKNASQNCNVNKSIEGLKFQTNCFVVTYSNKTFI